MPTNQEIDGICAGNRFKEGTSHSLPWENSTGKGNSVKFKVTVYVFKKLVWLVKYQLLFLSVFIKVLIIDSFIIRTFQMCLSCRNT